MLPDENSTKLDTPSKGRPRTQTGGNQTRTICVHEATDGSTRVWAWLVINRSGVGTEEIHYTDLGGSVPHEVSRGRAPKLGVYLFQVPGSEAVGPMD